MYKGMTVGVVVPAHNEEAFVGRVIETVPEYVDRVYAVDDCSDDETWAEIRRYAEQANRKRLENATLADGGTSFESVVEPIRHETNNGRGGAVKTGYRRALEDELDVIAVMDADGQMNPDMLSRIVAPVAEGWADYAKGTRLLHRDRKEMSSWRFFGNSLLTYLTKISSGYWKMSDPQNGFTAISGDALSRIDISSLYDDYGFLNDVLTTLNIHGFRVADIAHPAVYGDEKSGIRYSTFIPRLSLLLARNFVRRLTMRFVVRDFHPLVLLYLFGIVGSVAGGIGVLFTLLSLFEPGALFVQSALSIVLLLIGGISVAIAMAYDLKANEELGVKLHTNPDTSESRSYQRVER